ncbi:MAG: hypothetical protein Q9195_003499 [Heterodermia aff. obscurata]
MAGLNITFGIELEFVVAYQVTQYTDPNSAVRAHIIHLLQEAGFPMNGLTSPLNYNFWTIGTDGSIEAEPEDPLSPQWNDYRFSAVELITPKFYWSQSAMTAFQQLEKALLIIQENFSAFTNHSCGLHVHVGNEEWGFPRSTLKKFAQVVTTFERQLASIHPFHRINNVHCRPPSSNFESQDQVENVLSLQATRKTRELINYMSRGPHGTPRGFAYNLTNLITEGAPPTIEFRQHQATLNVVNCAAWASLACGLVARCHELTQADLRDLLTEGINHQPPTLLELLMALDLVDLASYYRHEPMYSHPDSGSITYMGEAYVLDPDTDVQMSDALNINNPGPAPPSPPMSTQDQIASDTEMCRRLCLNLRPRSTRSKVAAKAVSSPDEMDWDTEYALHDPLRGVEVNESDEEDENYQ